MKQKLFFVFMLVTGLLIHTLSAQTWSTAKRLTYNTGTSYYPATATDSSNNIHVVWHDQSPIDGDEIFYKKSTDGGTTWSAAYRLTYNYAPSYNPVIAIDSADTIHVVWYDHGPGNYEIFYKKSSTGGASWSAAKRLTYSTGTSRFPVIATDSSNNIHLVWSDVTPGNYEIFYKKGTNGGMTWSVAYRLTYNSGGSNRPAIAVDTHDNIHVVWDDESPGNFEIFYKKSTDGGTTWPAAYRLTYSSGDSNNPDIAVISYTHINVVWKDNSSGNFEIYFKMSGNGGVNWEGAKRTTYSSGDSFEPVIATDSSNNLHVVWEDNSPGNYEMFYKKGTAGGAAWSAAHRLTYTAGWSNQAAITVDSTSNIHFFWSDNNPGNYEIFYKKGT